ncbi:MAG: hypothetical protein ACUVQQ_09850 [Thermogutta sp.]
MQRRILGTTVIGGDVHEDVLGISLGVLHEHIIVAIALKRIGIEEFKLRFVSAASGVGFDELTVGKRALRILVQHSQVGMAGRRIQVVVDFLHVLAVVPLGIRQSEEAFLEERVAAIP